MVHRQSKRTIYPEALIRFLKTSQNTFDFTNKINVRWLLYPATTNTIVNVESQCLTNSLDVKFMALEVGQLPEVYSDMWSWRLENLGIPLIDENIYEDDCREKLSLEMEAGKTYLIGLLAKGGSWSDASDFKVQLQKTKFSSQTE